MRVFQGVVEQAVDVVVQKTLSAGIAGLGIKPERMLGSCEQKPVSVPEATIISTACCPCVGGIQRSLQAPLRGAGDQVVSIHKWPFRPISASPMSGICKQPQILILEILPCIPVVKIFPFLDLERNCLFLDGH